MQKANNTQEAQSYSLGKFTHISIETLCDRERGIWKDPAKYFTFTKI